jgi:hypothetical protein
MSLQPSKRHRAPEWEQHTPTRPHHTHRACSTSVRTKTAGCVCSLHLRLQAGQESSSERVMGCKVSKLDDQEAITRCVASALADAHGGIGGLRRRRCRTASSVPSQSENYPSARPFFRAPPVRVVLRIRPRLASLPLPPRAAAALRVRMHTGTRSSPSPRSCTDQALGASTLKFYYARSRPPPLSVAVAQRALRSSSPTTHLMQTLHKECRILM